MSYGGIEAGGTKWVCGIGEAAPVELEATETFPTATPRGDDRRAREVLRERSGARRCRRRLVRADRHPPRIGDLGSHHHDAQAGLGPHEPGRHASRCARASRSRSTPTSTPPRWPSGAGAPRPASTPSATSRSGPGSGAARSSDGRLLHGLLHPEIGHMRVPHDRARDPFDGACPYHGDCLEGLASGEAIQRRWGRRGEDLSGDAEVWELESEYLALGLVNVICTLSPQRIILGGGIPKQPQVLPLVRSRVQRTSRRLPRDPGADERRRDRRLHRRPRTG